MVEKKVIYIVTGVVVLALVVAAVIFMTMGRDSPPSAIEDVMTPASIAVSDQAVKEDAVTIDSLFLDKPGYIVIHKVTAEGAPAAVIGNSALLTGLNENVLVTISDYSGEEELIAMLHYDDGDGEYLFPGPDTPTILNNKIVMIKFKLS